MKIFNMIKYIGFWGIGIFLFKFVWFDYLKSVTTVDTYLIHGAIWPILIFTICWTIAFGIIIDDIRQEAHAKS